VDGHVRRTTDHKYSFGDCCKKSYYVFFEGRSAKYIVDLNVGGGGFNFHELVLDALVYFASKRLDEFVLMGVPVVPIQQIQQVLVFFN
jgi:hypothetical protein